MLTLLFKFVNIYGLKYITWFVIENTTGIDKIPIPISFKNITCNTFFDISYDNSGYFFYDESFDVLQEHLPNIVKNLIINTYNLNKENINVIIEKLY